MCFLFQVFFFLYLPHVKKLLFRGGRNHFFFICFVNKSYYSLSLENSEIVILNKIV